MLRSLLFILIFTLGSIQMAQAQDYARIDATILLYPTSCENPEELSKFITRDFQTEDEKVRVIYSWIIQNIEYDPDEYKKFNYNFKDYRERNKKEEVTRDKIINRTLQKGVAVCEGYAMLFERLCELQGIESYLVRGDTKTNFGDIGRSFNKNHMWNVVKIDGVSYLFDPTWGAGKYNEKFIREPSYVYYKANPDHFFKTHYPDIFEDSFISENVSRQEFSERPLIIDKDLLIEDIETPKNGTLYSEQYFGDVNFSINTIQAEEISYSFGGDKFPVKDVERADGTTRFNVPLDMGVSILLIYFDDQPAIGYKIE